MGVTFATSRSGLTAEQKEQAQVVVCMKVADMPTPRVKDAFKVECAGCNTQIWVSPNSPKSPPKCCMDCAMAMADADKATKQ